MESLDKLPNMSVTWHGGDKYKKNEACINFGRYALVVSNVLFFIGGAALICFAAWLKFVPGNQNLLTITTSATTRSYVDADMILVSVTGVCTIILAVVGCCGAVSNSRYVLGLFFLFLVVLFVQLMAVSGVCLWLQVKIKGDLPFEMKKSLILFNRGDKGKNPESLAWKQVQSGFQCCGVSNRNGYKDYAISASFATQYRNGTLWWQLHSNDSRVLWPGSCCKMDGETKIDTCHLTSDVPKHVYTEGCTKKVNAFLEEGFLTVTAVALALTILEIVHFATVRQLEAALNDNEKVSVGTIFTIEGRSRPTTPKESEEAANTSEIHAL